MDRRPVRADARVLANARDMRHQPAPAEKRLWGRLRDRKLGGHKFRRQVAIDRYIADFFCAEHRLIIEIDGESHFGDEANDAERTAKLNALGYTVIRFNNTDIFEKLDSVLLAILKRVEN